MATTIANGANRPINDPAGDVPDVSGGLTSYLQKMSFDVVVKQTVGFQVYETTTPVAFWGNWQPFSPRQLMLRPEGERAWTWFTLYAQPHTITLNVDDVVVWNGKQTRVMARRDYALYGYVEYSIVQDWTGAGPVGA